MAKWQQKYCVDWDATDGRNGGAHQTVWEVLMEMERFKYRARKEDLGAVALVLDLAEAFERVSLPVVWAWATHFSFPRKILRCFAGTSCGRLDLCWSATLPWNIAGYIWVENHRSCVCVGETVGKIGEADEIGERTCACGQCQVRQGMRRDTWMTIGLRDTKVMCNPELCSS